LSATVVQAGELRIARLEALRGIASLGVLISHAYIFSHGIIPGPSLASRFIFSGGYGLNVFFAMTGYLLFWPFVKGRVDLATYARNRVLRIVPLYVIAIAVLLIAQGGDPDWWRFVLALQNYSSSTIASAKNLDPLLWSVIVEMHFYLLLPLIAIVARRWAGMAVLVALALALHGHSDAPLWKYNLPDTFVYFVVGMVLAMIRRELEDRRPRWLAGPAGQSFAWLAVSILIWLIAIDRYGDELLAAAASFFTVGACVLPLRESALRRLLDWRPLVLTGVISYSLYVWHLPIMHALYVHVSTSGAAMLAILPGCLLVAVVSYRVIEAPFLRLRRRWSDQSARILEDPWPASATSSSTPS
jgi:peptidoglycan/LPS O-acetylase OafA/YrhL